MNSAVNFILESGISLSFLALIYILFLRKETFFKLNRLFLIGSVVFSVLLPFLKFRIYEPQPIMLAEITVTPYRNLIEAVTVYGKDFSGSVEQAILSTNFFILVFLAGVAFFMARLVFRIVQLMNIIRKNKVQILDGFKLVEIEKDFSPYSFLNYIFVSSSLKRDDNYNKMIAHELEHVKQGHSFDVIILELLTVFQWFNPFMWMLRRAIRENHEYLADQAVLKSGINRGFYKSLLLNQFVGEQLIITNSFNYSLIKKRIRMMSRLKSSKLANAKLVFGFLVAISLVVAFACEQKESALMAEPVVEEQAMKVTIIDESLKIEGTSEDLDKLKNMFSGDSAFEIITDSLGNTLLTRKKIVELLKIDTEEQVFFIVEEMPEFPGGELALRKYISNAIEYPETAVKKGIQGKVYVTFVVAKNGAIANTKIARGVDPTLDKEAMRVVNSLPKWKPGTQRGKAVNVSYTVPINFVLQDSPQQKEDLKK